MSRLLTLILNIQVRLGRTEVQLARARYVWNRLNGQHFFRA